MKKLIWLLLAHLVCAQVIVTRGDIHATSSVTVTWQAASGATSYNVYRTETAGSNYGQVGAGIACCLFRDTGTFPQKVYVYAVTGVNGSGEGPKSADSNTVVIP